MKKMMLLTLVAITSGLWSSQADATCFQTCEVTIVDETCTDIGDSYVTEGETLYAAGTCYTQCCAPPSEEYPNGNCSTDYYPLEPELMSVFDSNSEQVEGSYFHDTGEICDEFGNLAYSDSHIDPGTYYLAVAPFGEPYYEFVDTFTVIEDEGTGCSTSGTSNGTSFSFLALFGAAALLRRRQSLQ